MHLTNDIFSARDGMRYRILTVEPGFDLGWVFGIDDENAWPERDYELARAHFEMRLQFYSAQRGDYLLPDGEFPSISQFRRIARARLELVRAAPQKRGPRASHP